MRAPTLGTWQPPIRPGAGIDAPRKRRMTWRFALIVATLSIAAARHATAGVDVWTSNGPFVTSSIGSARRLAVDPHTPTTLYAGSSIAFDCGAQVYKSTNGGDTWQTVLDEIGCVSAIVIDPTDARIVHVAVEDGFFTSTDGGITWGTEVVPDVAGAGAFTALALDPTRPTTLYAGTSTSCLNEYDCSGRMLKSTDGGSTWQPIASYETGVNAIAVDTAAAVYVAGGSDYSLTQPGITPRPGFLARSADGGLTWADITPVPGTFVMQLAQAPGNGALHAATVAGLFGSTDRGRSWRAEPARLPIDQLSVDPFDARSVFATGNHFNAGLYTMELQHSADGGASWATLTNPAEMSNNFSPGGLLVAPTQPTTLYVAYPDQVLRTSNVGSTWQPSGLGLGSVVVARMAIDPFDASLYATAGTVYRSADRAATWIAHGETLDFLFDIAFDPTRAGTVYTTSFDGVRKSIDGAHTWRAINHGLPYEQGSGGLPSGALAIDPAAPDVLYLAATALYTSDDGGESWQMARNGLPNDLDARNVVATPGVVYAGTLAGVYASNDHGVTWRSLGVESVGLRFVTDIAVDPRHAEQLYVASFEGIGRSLDSGATWTRITAGSALDGVSCTSIAVSPLDSATLYVGTFIGAFRSRDGGATWEAFSPGLTNNDIVDLLVEPSDPRIVYAATQFTGIYVIQQSDVAPPPTATATGTSTAPPTASATVTPTPTSTPTALFTSSPTQLPTQSATDENGGCAMRSTSHHELNVGLVSLLALVVRRRGRRQPPGDRSYD